MASGAAKVALFDAFASVAQALGSGRRAEIVDLLAQGERSVEEIANEISQSVANTSQHLHVLSRAGLVRSRREGTRIFYRLASERVGDLWAAVRDVAVRHVAELSVLADEYLGERDGVEPVTSADLARRRCRCSPHWCPSCPGGARSSPTAGVPTVSMPTTLSVCSAL